MPLTIWNCVLSYKQNDYFSEKQLALPRNYFHNRFPGSNFLLPHFKQVAIWVFRWQVCYLLLLNSNPEFSSTIGYMKITEGCHIKLRKNKQYLNEILFMFNYFF